MEKKGYQNFSLMVYDIISSAGKHTEREDIGRKNQIENSMIRWQYCQMSETWIVYLQYEESLKKNSYCIQYCNAKEIHWKILKHWRKMLVKIMRSFYNHTLHVKQSWKCLLYIHVCTYNVHCMPATWIAFTGIYFNSY